MFGQRPQPIDWLTFPPRHFYLREILFHIDGFPRHTGQEKGLKKEVSGCKHRKEAVRVAERSGRRDTLAERLKIKMRMP